jgi:hypothetical protein
LELEDVKITEDEDLLGAGIKGFRGFFDTG